MSYYKMTSIGGYRADGTYKNTVRAGHWSPASIARLVSRMGLVRNVSASHSTSDMSGKGYGGYDRQFKVERGQITEVPLTRYQREYNQTGDADDVASAYDD